MKVVYVSYPSADRVGVPADAEHALGLRELLDGRTGESHELVTTSDKGEELDRHLADAEILVTTPFWPVYLDESRIKAASNLKLVITAGVGSDHTDPETAREHGVTVAEVTGSNVVSVAEHNVLQILALVRNFLPAHADARETGEHADRGWNVAEVSAPAHDLEGKTVGIVGLGAIGARTALRLKGFDVPMLYYANHRRSPAEEATLGVRYARLDTLVAQSDVICLALPLMAGSQALFGPERIRAMKPGSWLVNTARGPIVDRDALAEALESGHLAGYAGDTWYPQPAPADHPWRRLPWGSEAMTIHYSGMTVEAQERIREGVHEMVTAHLDGAPQPEDFVVVDPTA